MATSRPFAYNPSLLPISGTTQLGDLIYGTPFTGFTSSPQFWNGPDEDLKYIIAYQNELGNQPNPVGIPAYVRFWGCNKNDLDFIELSEYVSGVIGSQQTFATANDAKIWLNNNGFWTSYDATSVTPTPTSTLSITPTPSVTTTATKTPTPTPTPTSSGVIPVGTGYNFFIAEGSPGLPPSSNGNIEFFYSAGGGIPVTYNPNYTGGTFELYFNRYASDGTDNFTAMQALDTTGGTITMTQGVRTAVFSGTALNYTYNSGGPWLQLTVSSAAQQIVVSSGPFVSGTSINVSFGAPAPSPTPTATSVTPTPTPTAVTGFGFNLVALPYNFPISGNSIMNSAGGITSGSTDPNVLAIGGRGFYINSIDNTSTDRTGYFSSFTGQSVTITLSQTGSTAIYSGDTNSFKSWVQSPYGTGFVFGAQIGVPPSGVVSGNATLIQSASTQWTIGLPVYVSLVTN